MNQCKAPGFSVVLVLAVAVVCTQATHAAPGRGQLRTSSNSVCGAEQCFSHTGYLQDAGQASAVAGEVRPTTYRIPFTTQPSPYSSRDSWGNNVRGVSLGERGDEPCSLKVLGTTGTNAWDGCGGNGPRSELTVDIDGAWALVGLRICTNNRDDARGDLVKGIGLRWAKRPHEASPGKRITRTSQRGQPNCSKWGRWVSCPVGKAAQTLIVHHDAMGGRRAAVGLQLECHGVQPVCLSGNDPAWSTYSGQILACHAEDD